MRPLVDISTPFDELVDKAEECLATEHSVYQRNGELVIVSDDDCSITPLKSSVARYLLSRAADWVREEKPVHPPLSVAKCIVDRNRWAHIPYLRSVSPFPPMSAEGDISCDAGYDGRTRVYYNGDMLYIPNKPSREQAKAAADKLLGVVCDFPFAAVEHKSAWLAALLSPLSRYMHDGNIPIVVVQANIQRAGKSTLVQLISHILTGSHCPLITHTKNEDEERKRMLAYLRAGRSIVLIDNVVGGYGGANVNALATSRIFEDRTLGHSKLIRAANDAVWYITGNNIVLATDTAERCLNIRLHSTEERPHLRDDFKHSDIFDVVKRNRSDLLSAALTILKAYAIAGFPVQNIPSWGGFEAWSRIVRGALVWIGLRDPALTRDELENDADEGRMIAIDLIEGWAELQDIMRSPDGLTTREALDALSTGFEAPKLRSALEEMGPRLPSPHTLSRRFRDIRGRNIGGRVLLCASNHAGHRWYVEDT